MQTNEHGDVILNIGANIRGAKATLNDLSRSMRNVYRSFSGQSVSTPQLDALDAKAKESAKRIDELRQKLNELRSSPSAVRTDEFQRVVEKSVELHREAGRISADIENMRASTVDFSQQIAAAEGNLQRVRSEIEKSAAREKELKESGRAFLSQAEAQPEAFNKANQELQREQANLAGIQSKMQSVQDKGAASSVKIGDSIRNMSSKIASGFRKIRDHASKSAKSASQSFNGVNASMKKGLKTLLKYGLGMRSFFVLFRKLRSAIVDSYKELAEHSTEVNSVLENVKNAANRLKASIAVAVEPLVNTFAPAIAAVADNLANIMGKVGSFFAALTGQKYVYKALSVQNDYADSLKDTAESAGEAEKALDSYLSPLDDINRFTDNSGNANKTDPSSAAVNNLTKNAIPSRFKEMAETVRGYFKDLFKPIKSAWDTYGAGTILEWRKSLLGVKGTARDILTAFKNVWTNGTGERLAGNVIKLWKTVGGIIGGIIGTFRNAWNKDALGEGVIQSFIDKADSLIGFIRNVAKSFKTVWEGGTGETIWTNILTIVKNVNDIIGGFWDILTEAWSANDNGINIWGSILGIVEDISEWFKDISKITLDWVKELDLNPIVTAAGDLLEAFRDFAKVLGDKFKDVYEEILLPLAKWTIEKAVPKLIEWLGDALDFLGSVIKDIPIETLKTFAGVVVAVFAAFKTFKLLNGIAGWFSKITSGFSALGKALTSHPYAAAILGIATALTAIYTAVQVANRIEWERSDLKKATDDINSYSDSLNEAADNMKAAVDSVKDQNIEVKADLTQVRDLKKRLQEIIKDGVIDEDEMPEYDMIVDLLGEVEGFQDYWSNLHLERKDGEIYINDNIDDVNERLNNLMKDWEIAQLKTSVNSAKSGLFESKLQNQRDIKQAQSNVLQAARSIDEYFRATSTSMFGEFTPTVYKYQQEGLSGIEKAYREGALDFGTSTKAKKLIEAYINAKDSLENYQSSLSLTEGELYDLGDAQRYLYGETDNYSGALYLVREGLLDQNTVYESVKGTGIDTMAELEAAANRQRDSQVNANTDVQNSYGDTERKADSTSKNIGSAIGNVASASRSAAGTIGSEFDRGFSDAETAARWHMDNIRRMLEREGLTGFTFAQTQGFISAGQLPIPHLAQGKVIPAGRPFLALLGDQSNGKNLEAPEGLIRQIFREEIANRQPSKNVYHVNAEANGRNIFKLILDEGEMQKNQTGSNPFNVGGAY